MGLGPGELGHLSLVLRQWLQDVDDKEQHESEDNQKDKEDLPKRFWTIALCLELTPVPRIGIIRIGRDRTYWRRHRSSVRGRPTGPRQLLESLP